MAKRITKTYDQEFKSQAVKLAQEIGGHKAADELVPSGTIYAWVKAFKEGRLEAKAEDECNDTYGRIRMHQALELKQPEGVNVPSERTVYRIMEQIGISHRPKRKPNGVTKADKETRKSDDLMKRNFKSDKPFEKCVTDMTEVKCLGDKLYVSAVFDCFDSAVLGLAMDTNMEATLCEKTLKNTYQSHSQIRGYILHSDRGTQYTSKRYRNAIDK